MPSYKKLQVHSLSKDFRQSTEVVDVPNVPTANENELVIRNHYAGVNATDINVTNGMYGVDQPPFGCGLEAVGIVEEVGPNVSGFKNGDAVVYQALGAFAQYNVVAADVVHKVPECSPKLLPIMISGISASISLEVKGQMKSNETVLVTAAAGCTGQFAVQLAKKAGNHVIGTCSSKEKADLLKSLGCDRVINYTEEDVGQVLQKEYPDGIDLIFETVGGKLFKDVVSNIAVNGRVLAIGMISSYLKQDPDALPTPDLIWMLLPKNASLHTFNIFGHPDLIPTHVRKLIDMIDAGEIESGLDPTTFQGVESIPSAVDHMYAKKNLGKIVIKL